MDVVVRQTGVDIYRPSAVAASDKSTLYKLLYPDRFKLHGGN